MAIKIAESALKRRVGRVSGNTGIFFLGLISLSLLVSSGFTFWTCCVPDDEGDFKLIYLIQKWAATWQNQQSDCAPSEDSDQPGHPPSLIRVFAVCMKKAWVLSYPLCAQRRLWSDWADAQDDLSLRWAHTHFVGFVMLRLIYLIQKCLPMITNSLLNILRNQGFNQFNTVKMHFIQVWLFLLYLLVSKILIECWKNVYEYVNSPSSQAKGTKSTSFLT